LTGRFTLRQEDSLNDTLKVLRRERFRDEISGAILHRLNRLGDSAVGGNHNDRNLTPLLLKAREQLATRHLGHLLIRDHEIKVLSLKKLKRGESVVNNGNVEILATQARLYGELHLRIVIGHENSLPAILSGSLT
jgi:hypothetical protein